MTEVYFSNMRHKLNLWCCALSLIALVGGCKKAEQPAAVTPRTDTAPTPQAETAPVKAPASAEGIVLKVKWPVGARYVYRMDLDQRSTNKIPQMPTPIQQNVTMAMTYAISVIKEIPNGGRELELEFLANEMEIKMGAQVMMSFDSKETGKNEAQNPFAAPFRKMVGSKISLQTDADGKVDKVIGHKEWLATLTADAGPAGGMVGQQFTEGLIRQLAGIGAGLPDKPVQVGATWPFKMDVPAGPTGKIEVDSKVTLTGFEDHDQHKCAVLNFTGTLGGASGIEAGPMGKMSIDGGTVTGQSWFDPELGALIESVQDQSMSLKGDMPGAPGGGARPAANFTIEIGQKVIVKLVDSGKANK
jgi:Family of unknown function (DUF6263)